MLVTTGTWLAVGAAPAAAMWSGTIERGSDATSGVLVLKLTANAPSYGVHVGLALGGYAVSGVSADQPGPTGGLPPGPHPACSPTSDSGLTTHNTGVDCSFGSQITSVTVTFTTTPRYPDGAGGVAYDDTDQVTNPITGPSPLGGELQSLLDKNRLKGLALEAAALSYEATAAACRRSNSVEGIPFFGAYGLEAAASALILSDREDCLNNAEKTYQARRAQIDPPDQNFLAVAVPAVRSAKGLGPRRCPKSAPRRAGKVCATLRRLLLARDDASARTAAMWGAIATTLDRLSTASSAGNTEGVAIQNGALRALRADVLQAGKVEDAANAAIAAELRKRHLSPKLTRKQVAAGLKDVRSGRLPAAVLEALARRGISKAAFRAMLANGKAPQPKAVKLTTLLRQKTASGPAATALAAEVAKITPQELANLAKGMLTAGAIEQPLSDLLVADATAGAIAKFVSDASAARGEAGALLKAAGQALAGAAS